MSQKKFAMLSGYKNLSTTRDWLWKQTPHNFGIWKNIQILANASEPDFLLLYQYDFNKRSLKTSNKSKFLVNSGKFRDLTQKYFRSKSTNPKKQVHSLIQQVPEEKTIFLLREPPLPEIVKINQRNYQLASKYCGYVSGPDDLAPIPDYMPAIWYVNRPFSELDSGNIPEKSAFCSWITSGIARSQNHRQRLTFLKTLQDSEVKFDLYGRGLPQWSNSLGSVENKWHVMAPYYYNLAIENYAENDLYVSEKLWDALLSWCLPIYYGGSAADKLLPSGSFLRLPSLDQKGVAYIKEVTANPDAWYEAKDKIAEARQIILHELNLLNWLNNFVDQH
ncbi:MAG: glycosyltransferase family 10 [Xenococcaceae cyanobacterium MO_167.B52]|nr:glycosyltransferase family 10 [Xenococcaceae cyanobacterium MO_167.B52]